MFLGASLPLGFLALWASCPFFLNAAPEPLHAQSPSAADMGSAMGQGQLGYHCGPVLLCSPRCCSGARLGQAVSASWPPVKSTALAQALTAVNPRYVSNEDILRSRINPWQCFSLIIPITGT